MKKVTTIAALVLITCSPFALADQVNEAVIMSDTTAIATGASASAITVNTNIDQLSARVSTASTASKQSNQAAIADAAAAISDGGSVSAVEVNRDLKQRALEGHFPVLPPLPAE